MIAMLPWIGFLVFILVMLAIDLGVVHREAKVISTKQALFWTGLCAVLSLLFCVGIYFAYSHHWFGLGTNPHFPLTGREAALQYLTGWIIEQTLSMDNVFVISMIFAHFRIPMEYQYRVLFWGILGALIFRGIMIGMGAALIQTFSWSHYVFGAILIYAAIRIVTVSEEDFSPENSILYRLAYKLYPISSNFDGEKFLTTLNGRSAITPLFLVLLLIEGADVIFAVDSVPAIFAITSDPFIVFTSNVFAILSLRSLYFALAALMVRFQYLKHSILVLLLFIGLKMMLTHHVKISTEISLLFILVTLGVGVLASLRKSAKD